MLKEDTELMFIDEWCKQLLSASSAKTVLQGGLVPRCVKFQSSEFIVNNAAAFITCYTMPGFGDEQDNVERILWIFKTVSLSFPVIEAPKWIRKNAMQCLVWIIKQINSNLSYIDQSERFYEKDKNTPEFINRPNLFPEDEFHKLKSIEAIDLTDITIEPQVLVSNLELSDVFVNGAEAEERSDEDRSEVKKEANKLYQEQSSWLDRCKKIGKC